MIFKVSHQSVSYSSQSPIGSVKEGACRKIIFVLKPFSLEHPPKNLGDVKLWRIRRHEEKMQSSFLPYVTKCEQSFCLVYGRIVKHDHGLALNGYGEVVKKTNHFVRIDASSGCTPMGMAMAVNHGEAVEPGPSLGRDINVFLGKFPAIRHIRLLTNMGFVPIIKVYGSVLPQPFKLLQLPQLILVKLWRWFALWTFPYTSKSCANALKKRLSVSSQAVFPVAASHCALAVKTLERSFSMARRMISSSCVPIMGLRPRTGRVFRPLIPSSSKRLAQLLTVVWCISKRSPIGGELRPCDFNNTALQCIRKACDEPLRYPSSNADYCIGLNFISVILPIWNVFSFMGITDFWHKHYHSNYFCG